MRLFKWMLIPWALLWLGSAAAVTPPVCLPKVKWPAAVDYGSVAASDSTRYDTWSAWVCDTPTGYTAVVWLFARADLAKDILDYASGAKTKAQADAECQAQCTDPTATESAFIQAQLAKHKPPARVSFNGSNHSRSVYTMTSAGALNPTPVAGATVAVADPCDSGKRIPGTTYYSVQGRPNATTAGQTLGDVYAVCTVSLPIGAN